MGIHNRRRGIKGTTGKMFGQHYSRLRWSPFILFNHQASLERKLFKAGIIWIAHLGSEEYASY